MDTENFSKENTLFASDLPSEDVRVKIIGVGGAGTNAVDGLQLDHFSSVRMAAINTDAQALANSPIQEKYMIGRSVTRGLSAGGEAIIGRKAAQSDREKMTAAVGGADLIFLVAGLGGGTGSGALPVVADVAAEQGALVVAFVAMPFTMEGSRRSRQAQDAVVELRACCGAVIPIPNDILLQNLDEQATVLHAFAQVDSWISRGIYSICSMLFQTGMINIDFTSLKQVFATNGGKTLFGLGKGDGQDYTRQALKELMMCPLLHVPETATCADKLLVNIIGGTDLSMSQVNEIISFINEKFYQPVSTVFGAVVDEQLQSTLDICVIGTTNLESEDSETCQQTAQKPVVVATPNTSIPVQSHSSEKFGEENVSMDDAHSAASEDSAPEEGRVTQSTYAPGESSETIGQPSEQKDHSGKTEDITNPKGAQTPNARKNHSPQDSHPQEEFSFIHNNQLERGLFGKTNKNEYKGEDLDVPTYMRRGVKLAK